MIGEFLFFKDIIKIFIAVVVFGAYWLGRGICLLGECAWGHSIYEYVGDGWWGHVLVWAIGVAGFIVLIQIFLLLYEIISAVRGKVPIVARTGRRRR